MANETKKFAGLETLQAFLDGCKTLFASITHNHDEVYYTKSEIDNLELITVDDIHAICVIKPEIKLINFSIEDTPYQAEEGMTWLEWCNSDYNVDKYMASPGDCVYDHNLNVIVSYNGSEFISDETTIVADYNYTFIAD